MYLLPSVLFFKNFCEHCNPIKQGGQLKWIQIHNIIIYFQILPRKIFFNVHFENCNKLLPKLFGIWHFTIDFTLHFTFDQMLFISPHPLHPNKKPVFLRFLTFIFFYGWSVRIFFFLLLNKIVEWLYYMTYLVDNLWANHVCDGKGRVNLFSIQQQNF